MQHGSVKREGMGFCSCSLGFFSLCTETLWQWCGSQGLCPLPAVTDDYLGDGELGWNGDREIRGKLQDYCPYSSFQKEEMPQCCFGLDQRP